MLVSWQILCKNDEESCDLLEKLLEVAAVDPLIMDEVMRGIVDDSPCIRAQAAGMIEKITRVRPLFLRPYKRVLLSEFSAIEQPEVRCQMAVLYGRVFWDEWEMQQVVILLGKWIDTEEDENTIIHSLQSLYTLATQKARIQSQLIEHLKNAMQHRSSAVRTLATKLLNQFGSDSGGVR